MAVALSMVESDWTAGRTAAEIGRKLARDGGGAVALAKAYLARIAAQTSPVFLTVTEDRALKEAKAADVRLSSGRPLSPLDGVPVAWKDLVDMAGERTTVASELHRDAPVAQADAPVVTNAARAGLVSLGKVNLSEYAYSALGQNPHFGTPLNPRGAEPRAPGGSSSGSAVAVGAGLAPLALGSDTGGSVRIPASFCGVTGFKTSHGQIPVEGCFTLSRSQDTLGPLGLSVEDCALAYDAYRGTQVVREFMPIDAITVVVPDGLVVDGLDPGVARAFTASVAALRASGVTVKEFSLPDLAKASEMMAAMGSVIAAEAFTEHRALLDSADAARLDQRVRARIEIGRSMSAEDLVRLQFQRQSGGAAIREALDGAFLAMPTTPITAPRLSDFEGDDDAFKRLNAMTNRNTSIGSFYNMPGLAIPNGLDADGMPTSLLLSASAGEDERLLSAGLTLEPVLRHGMTK